MTTHLLALETSSSVCGVALAPLDGSARPLHTLEHDATAEHAERLLPMVDAVLEQGGVGKGALAAVAFGQGPGGFTGLRVACGVAQGLAYALGIPVVPIDSLMAAASQDDGDDPQCPVIVVQDARMQEVYVGAYRRAGDGWLTLQAPILLAVDQFSSWVDQVRPEWGQGRQAPARIVGDGPSVYPDLGTAIQARSDLSLGASLRATAHSVAQLAVQQWHAGATVSPEFAAPLYVRDKVAFTSAERAQGAGGNPRAARFFASIAPMKYDDLDAVASIEASVQEFPWTYGNFQDGLEAGYSAFVARRDGQIVGFYMTLYAPDVAHLLVIAVSPEHQNQGVGAKLLQHCEQEARRRGSPAMVLEVRPSNHNALRFYRNQGFKLLAMRKGYYPAAHGQREDACIMKKDLVPVGGNTSHGA